MQMPGHASCCKFPLNLQNMTTANMCLFCDKPITNDFSAPE